MVDIWFTTYSVSARIVQDFVYQRYRYTVLLQWSWSLSPWNAIGITVKNADFFWGDIDDENCENSVEKSEKSPKKKLEVKATWMLHSAQFINRESVYV